MIYPNNPYNQYNINPYQNNFNNMGQNIPQPQTQAQPVNNLIRVTGINGANAYSMPANSAVVLFDNAEPIMYIKTTDGAGFATVTAYKFQEYQEAMKIENNSDFITRKEFEEFKNSLVNSKHE